MDPISPIQPDGVLLPSPARVERLERISRERDRPRREPSDKPRRESPSENSQERPDDEGRPRVDVRV